MIPMSEQILRVDDAGDATPTGKPVDDLWIQCGQTQPVTFQRMTHTNTGKPSLKQMYISINNTINHTFSKV